MLAKKFGEGVRAARVARGFSQEELAAHCELHRTYIGAVERGERNITLKNAEKIARALNTTLSALLLKCNS